MSKHHRKNKVKTIPLHGEATFSATSTITLESKPSEGKSTMKECVVTLDAHPQIKAAWMDHKGELNTEGLKAQTQALLQGLISNIHYGHQFGLRDSAEHMRYIIEYLEKGFSHAGMEAFKTNN